ncbi:hypothetical protein A3J98_01805 [candidate division WS6 bacterium RIFOXYC1_FULL_33_10]|uniref:Uncharacterized protein n=2 Tax=Candidatus Dojkabacteria TaxID=74243 RepID=A0A1F4UJE2_9BACT|nr:MAG: hypothetical protein A2400_01850 [candidate division WS6 bacterium RIFOXYB1_FULL_33_14]OGC45380.1 MAG: hypothetical protein A3J98_01805 [candidate division WS6 bacterium RIFOXYC1_FULL_33_10]
MTELSEFKSIDIEGSDQVGKGDAVKNLAQEYCNNGIDTTVVSLPYYASPIGYCIRTTLKEGLNPDMNIEREREVHIKMSLFALNRLEILNSILSNPNKGIYLFDRGPFSNALTIGYALTEGQNGNEIEDLADTALDLDKYFREVLNIDRCVIRLQTEEKKWTQSRLEKADLYEKSDVQEKSKEVYSIFEQRIGDGWKNITTKKSSGWRRREDIKNDCMDFASTKLGIYSKRYRSKRVPQYLGIKEIQTYLYKDSDVNLELREAWLGALKENCKDDIYKLSKDISESIVKSFERVTWYNEDIRNEIKRILELNPEVLYVFEYMYGERFLVKFLNSLNE